MIEFTAVILLTAVVKKVVDTLKYAIAFRWTDVATQLVAWVGGFLALWMVASTPWGDDLSAGGHSLGSLSVVALLAAGMLVGSGGSVLYDGIKAVSAPRDLPPDPDSVLARVRN